MRGAFGIIIVRDGVISESHGIEEGQTNVRMELYAAFKAIEHLGAEGRTIRIFTSLSMLTNAIEMHRFENWASRGWRNEGVKLENESLWKAIFEVCYPTFVEFRRPENEGDQEMIKKAAHYATVAFNLPMRTYQSPFWPIDPKTGIHTCPFDPHG